MKALFFIIAWVFVSSSANAEDIPDLTLPGTDGARHSLHTIVANAKATVIVFFSAHCSCQSAHDERLRSLFNELHPKGVEIVAVDSEADASLEEDVHEVQKRRYPFPILADTTGELAKALGAEYATYAVVIDQKGTIRYRGGMDSDRAKLHERARFYVRDAVLAILAGRAPDITTAKALGCSLRHQ